MMNGNYRQTLLLETTEGVHFRLPLAGPLSRAIAWFIDALCVIVVVMMLGKVVAMAVWFNADVSAALNLLIYFGVFTGYAMVFEWKARGQTLGKRLMCLRVVDAQGYRLTLPQVVLRNLLRAVDQLPLVYVVGGISCLLSRHGQRLGDLAANTVVVDVAPRHLPDILVVSDSFYNSIRAQPRLVARLRQTVTPEQARIALDAVLRREQLESSSRVTLFAQIAMTLKTQIDFPEECLTGLSDERLVLNVVESLFNAQ